MPQLDLSVDDLMGQISDTFGGLIESRPVQCLKRWKRELEREPSDTYDQLPRVVQLLTTLVLRHESQLQALAVQGTFILFFQPGTASILPQIQQATQQWKQATEKRETTQSLRLCLVMLIAQTLLDRMLKIAQAPTTSEIWQEAVKHMILTEHGGWNFLTWNAKEKRMQPTEKAPISMTSAQSMLEELVELIRDPKAVVRFKRLKASNLDSKQVKVMPWMLQINMRRQRLHELLQTLSTSAVWNLMLGRLRPHTIRENPLATDLVKTSNGLFRKRTSQVGSLR